MEDWVRWVGDVGEIDLQRQTQHKPETNPKQIDDEDEDPIEQIGDRAWGDGVSGRQSKEEIREREKKMKRKKEERREAGERERKRKKREIFFFLMRKEREV